MTLIARGGGWFVLGALTVTILFSAVTFYTTEIIRFLFLILGIFSGLCILMFFVFFRDPTRIIGDGFVAAADGIIREVATEQDPDVGRCVRVSTFMNVYHVHVNRMPCDGKILRVRHVPGSYFPAFKKESERNERVVHLVETQVGMIKIVQIAGFLARRIVPYVQENDIVKKGERIGLIRFGSRVDVLLPAKNIRVLVQKYMRVKAGVDTIASLHA